MGYLLYDQDDFTYFKVVEVFGILGGIQLALNELKPGYGLAYSKFTSEGREKNVKKVPSRVGMLIMYTPAFLICSWFFVNNVLLNKGKPEEAPSTSTSSLKARILCAATSVHFFKRVLETLFVHRYSGTTGLSAALRITSGYIFVAANLNLQQQASAQLTPPAVDLTWVGVVVFVVGILGNFYHHWLLRGLRKGEDKKYVIPEGGLFAVFISPHYIFEIVTFTGLAFIGQTFFSVASLIFVVLYLGARSYSTKQWYHKKIDGFPENRWALIPYVL